MLKRDLCWGGWITRFCKSQHCQPESVEEKHDIDVISEALVTDGLQVLSHRAQLPGTHRDWDGLGTHLHWQPHRDWQAPHWQARADSDTAARAP